MGRLWAVYPADEALRIDLKLEPHDVPNSARWLNFSEVEAISVCRQCLRDGVNSVDQITEHLTAWQSQRTIVNLNLTVESFRKTFAGVYRPSTPPPAEASPEPPKPAATPPQPAPKGTPPAAPQPPAQAATLSQTSSKTVPKKPKLNHRNIDENTIEKWMEQIDKTQGGIDTLIKKFL